MGKPNQAVCGTQVEASEVGEQVLDAGPQVIGAREVRQNVAHAFEPRPITAPILTSSLGNCQPGPGDDFRHSPGDLDDRVVLGVGADVEDGAVDGGAGGGQPEHERPGDIAHVNQRPPGGTIAVEPDLAPQVGAGRQVVDHQVGPQSRRVPKRGGVAERNDAEGRAGKLPQTLLGGRL